VTVFASAKISTFTSSRASDSPCKKTFLTNRSGKPRQDGHSRPEQSSQRSRQLRKRPWSKTSRNTGDCRSPGLRRTRKRCNQNPSSSDMPHATFSTPFGLCAIAWNEVGVTRFLLPDPERRGGQSETSPPSWINGIIDRVLRHLGGDVQDFSDVPFDFSRVPEFMRAVLCATLTVKPGQTATYGDLASAIGQPPGVSRAVGTALGGNPWPLLIPCHRIISATGKMTGFSGPGGVATKVKLLALEGAQLLAE